MPIAEAGGPSSSLAPGSIPIKLDPTPLIWFKIKLCAPAPTEIITIIEATPITIPSIVKKLRNLFDKSDVIASFEDSRKFIRAVKSYKVESYKDLKNLFPPLYELYELYTL